ncbi:MAG: HlyD family efflux transporter periplasmic adaptor subunit [Planctomycetia bacterium]|nr:HlyD family efflux transporter periplasmic adaptor subunit [Planctomycetia bacterium]
MLWLAVLLVWPGADGPAKEKDVVKASTVHLRLIEQADVPAQVSGILTSIPAKEGTLVAEGDVVAQIDDSDARLSADRARLDLQIASKKAASSLKVSVAKNALTETRFAKSRAELELEAAKRMAENEAPIKYAKRGLEVATSHLKRAQNSRKTLAASVSDNEMDNLLLNFEKMTYEADKADYELAVARLTERVKKSDIDSLELSIVQSELAVQQAEEDAQITGLTKLVKQNELAVVERDLERRKITAPLAGMVVQVLHRRGEWVQPGEKVLRILRLDRLRAEGFVQSKDLESDLMDAPVRVRVALPGKPEAEFAGRIVFVSPEIDAVNSQVRVFAEIDNPKFELRPGLRVEMTIDAKAKK